MGERVSPGPSVFPRRLLGVFSRWCVRRLLLSHSDWFFMREGFSNFATTALSAAIPTTTALSFNVTTGQGTLFPVSNFLVVVDTEIILISSRSVDAFTVATGGRGYDGSVASS